MARCEVCGNDYARPIEVSQDGERHVFDSFECAIHAMAPSCGNCGVRVVGHGIEGNETVFCSAPCAGAAGVTGVADHA